MKADSTSLLDLISQPDTIFDIPVYQRRYEWSKNQCFKLLNDLEKLIKNPKENHFLGTIVYITDTSSSVCRIKQVIDGQQRLTSCMLLLKAISVASDNQDLASRIKEQMLINKYVDENNHFKLRSVESDYTHYLNIMNNILDSPDISKMYQNFELFLDHIDKSNIDVKEFYNALNRMRVVYIELENNKSGENPQVIFESINSTGISLLPADLIRNFLLMGVSTAEQKELYKNYWAKIQSQFSNDVITEFIRHYLIFKKNKMINSVNVYEEYKQFFREEGFDAQYALEELYEFSVYYNKLRQENFDDPKFNNLIKIINALDRKSVYPYLMKLLKLQSLGKIHWNDLINIVETLESFIYRLLIVGKSQSINSVIAGLTKFQNDVSELKFIESTLLNKRFPKDTEFKQAFREIDIFKKRNNLAKITLIKIEKYLNNKYISLDDVEVSRIMPLELTNEWEIAVKDAESVNSKYGNTIGNLTLVKNSDVFLKKSYISKKDIYRGSDFKVTRDIPIRFKLWDKYSINQRSELLCKIAVKIWKRPNEKQFVIKENISGEHYLDEDLIVRGSKPIRLIIKNNEYVTSSWKMLLVSILDFAWDYSSEDFEKLKTDYHLKSSIFKNRNELRVPTRLNNGTYIETNFNATTVLALVSKIAHIYNIENDVSYILR